MSNYEFTEMLLIDIFNNNWDEQFIKSTTHKEYTYGSFFKHAMACALIFKKKYKLKKGEVLALQLPHTPKTLVIYLAVLICEGIVSPVDFLVSFSYLKNLLSKLKPSHTIVSPSYESKLNESCINFDKLWEEVEVNAIKIGKQHLELLKVLGVACPFLLTFTSGSEGEPKGVLHSFSNLIKSAKAFGKLFAFNKKSIFYHNLPMSYMAGILNLFILPLIWESKIVIENRFSVKDLLNFWEKPCALGVNVYWFIPTIISSLLKIDRSQITLSANTIGLVGTAPLPITHKANFEQKYGITLFASYGLSELLFVSTNFINNQKAGSVGPLLDGVKYKQAYDGELLIQVPWSFLIYWHSDMEHCWQDKYYKTGDLGKTSNGSIYITGRKKNVIIRGGINISPRVIENILHPLEIFEELVVLGTNDEILGEKVTCCFTKDSQLTLKEKRIIAELLHKKFGETIQLDSFIHMKFIFLSYV